MSAETLAGANSGLIFNWRPSRRRKLSIVSFLLASLLLHALGFYLFQIVYPPAVALLPAPGRVSIISPTTEEGRLLLRWLDAEDPALASTTQRPPDAKAFAPPKVAHVPSFITHQPALREPPPYAPDLRAPDSQPPGPVPQHRTLASAAAPVVKTRIEFGSDIAQLGSLQAPEMRFTRSNNESPQAARFRVAISRAGAVQFCFLQTSSGDPALDEQARQYLALCRFAGGETNPATADLLWTTAAIVWGSDLVAPKESP
jgi:protein TonB